MQYIHHMNIHMSDMLRRCAFPTPAEPEAETKRTAFAYNGQTGGRTTHLDCVSQFDQLVGQLVQARRPDELVCLQRHLRIVALRIVAGRHHRLGVLADRCARPALGVRLLEVVLLADAERI